MSTYVHRLVEVKINDKWQLVEWNNPLQKPYKINKFTAGQMGIDYDSLEKTQVEVYKGPDPSYEEQALYNHEPIIINNACTFRDTYLTSFSDTSWYNRGLPKDISDETKKWLNYYIYESSWSIDENGNPTIHDDKFDMTYITIAEIYSEIGRLRNEITEQIKKYADALVKLELKSLSVNTDTAKQMLDDEREDTKYILETINDKINCIEALESEASFADNIVNNPGYFEIENNIRLIVFKTC